MDLGRQKRRGAGILQPRALEWPTKSDRDSVFDSVSAPLPAFQGRFRGQFTLIKSLILPNSPSLIPLTFMTSSIVLKGRASMIA
jgi:hypothetical protein